MTPVRNLLAICATSGFLVLSHAEASEELSHDIASQPLAQALSEFATQTDLQVVYVSGIAANQDSKGTPRGLPAPEALQRLLGGTGLRFEFLNDRTVRILAVPSCAVPSGCARPPVGAAALVASSRSRPPSPDDPLEEVIVNGSRWWLDPTHAVAPVIVLDRRDIERGSNNSIGKVLQALPMTTGSPLNTNANAPGSAEAARRRRGGRRRIRPRLSARSAHGRVAQWPASTEQRPRCRRLGRSQYTADVFHRARRGAGGRRVSSCRCGCRRRGREHRHAANNHGLELSGTRTITERGDGEIVTGQAAIGFDLLGGTWSLGLDYVEQDGVTMDRRSYSALPLIIVDGNGTVMPSVCNSVAGRASSRFRKATLWDSSPVSTHLCRRHRPNGRRLSTVRALQRRVQSCAIQLLADAERAYVALAARLESAGRKREFLRGSTRSSPGVRAAGRTGSLIRLSRSHAGGRVMASGRQLLQPIRGRPRQNVTRRVVEARQPQWSAGRRSVARAHRARRRRRSLDDGSWRSRTPSPRRRVSRRASSRCRGLDPGCGSIRAG